MSGQYFVLLGATSAMGPLNLLTQLGAHIVAVDLDRPAIWKRIIEQIENSSATVSFALKEPYTGQVRVPCCTARTSVATSVATLLYLCCTSVAPLLHLSLATFSSSRSGSLLSEHVEQNIPVHLSVPLSPLPCCSADATRACLIGMLQRRCIKSMPNRYLHRR